MTDKKYEINISPRILELLGPNLYTNIYYILAELIANAYDADARNVWIFHDEGAITVEDDGKGMSYEKGDINKYLNVAEVTRTGEEDAYTPSGRKKMGRKGVGKLAALSVSENVVVKTIADGEKSGFILSRHPKEENLLEPLTEEEIQFNKVKRHGTAVVMLKPKYTLHATLDAVKKNLLRIFPTIGADFKIHLIRNDEDKIVARSDKAMVEELCALITLGEPFAKYGKYFDSGIDGTKGELLKTLQEKVFEGVEIMNNNLKEKRPYDIVVEGWIGAYKTTANRKQAASDFPDNFISLYANGKMGEFNILPSIGQNKLNEVYVVGQLHVDIFELSELGDMALSNRQGYKTDDVRYQTVIEYARNDLLPQILELRTKYASFKKEEQKQKKLDKQKENEKKFQEQVETFIKKTSSEAARRIADAFGRGAPQEAEKIIRDAINDNSAELGLKPRIDEAKKKLLISHTKDDKDFADVVYEMLLFNNIPKNDILYTNCDDEAARIPVGVNRKYGVYDYLRDFFVNSRSDQNIFVIFITSLNMRNSWGALVEVGAAWITRSEHKIFTINGFRPQQPLDVFSTWQASKRIDGVGLCADGVNVDTFCQFIEHISRYLHYEPKGRDENKKKLEKLGFSSVS